MDNANILKDDGAQVKLTVKLGTVLSDEIMGKKTITVATGKKPIDVLFEDTGNTYIKVAVATESKGFQSNKPATADPDKEFLNTSEVVFGYVTVLNTPGVKADDGYTNWDLGGTNPAFALNTPTVKTNAVLTIKEGGQFAASITGGKGTVSLR